MVIDAAGIQFLAEKEQLPMVADLRVEVEKRYGRTVLVVSHPTWAPYGSC